MKLDPVDERLERELSRLPRQTASEGFTRSVLDELDRRRRPGSRIPDLSLWGAVTAAAILMLAGLGYAYQQKRAADRAYEREVEVLQSTYQELLQEVAAIRQEVEQPAPLLYLGGDESTDLVVDLNQAFDDLPAASGHDVRARPANWNP